jgi:Tol biopolymer transport system component
VAYDVVPNGVIVWDSVAASNIAVSVPLSGAVNPQSITRTPIITRDGKHVAFLSNATNLVEGASSANLNIYVRDLEAQVTRLVSVNRDGAPSGVAPDIAPSLSADGNLIAFDSVASDLVDGDFNFASDVFVRDLNAGVTRLISRPYPSLARPTAARHSRLPTYPGCVSSNGNIVAFMSSDNNLSLSDTNEHIDSFVANLSTGAIFPVSTTMAISNRAGRFPIVSASGEYMIFYSQQPSVQIGTFDSVGPSWVFRFNLAQGAIEQVDTQVTSPYVPVPPFPSQERWNLPTISPDGNLVAYTVGNSANMQLFLRDMTAGTNQLVSVNFSGQASGYNSFNPILGSDSRWVVFESQAIDLVTNWIVGAEISLYARDLLSNTTTLISQDAFGNALRGKATSAVFVASSRYLTFQHASPNVLALMGYLYDLQTQQPPQMICSNCSSLSLSADARTLAFSRRRFGGPLAFDIWEKDLQTGQERLVSLNRTGTARANRSSSSPHISADGRFIVFQSEADDLVLNDHNRATDVFMRDRATGVTMLLSRNRHGTGSGNGGASNPIMAADGRTVVFHSNAGDLVEGDFNSAYDIFVLRLGAGDSDNDGLDDAWELAHFNDLSRDGHGDDDGDGLTDLQEFLAGTSPRSGESVLTVLSLTAFGSGETTLLWSAVPGRTYQVQFKSAVTNPAWIDLPGPVIATDTTASYIDPAAASERFYRVVLVQ